MHAAILEIAFGQRHMHLHRAGKRKPRPAVGVKSEGYIVESRGVHSHPFATAVAYRGGKSLAAIDIHVVSEEEAVGGLMRLHHHAPGRFPLYRRLPVSQVIAYAAVTDGYRRHIPAGSAGRRRCHHIAIHLEVERSGCREPAQGAGGVAIASGSLVELHHAHTFYQH